MADAHGFRAYDEFREYLPEDMVARAKDHLDVMRARRTIRDFSERGVSQDVIESCLQTACLAPSGANQQPWHFAAVSDSDVKQRIRKAAEQEEREFYERRAPDEWLEALEPFGTDANKPFLETAPWLIAIFAQSHGLSEDGSTYKHYYVQESVGIATGFLIGALSNAGLATLTHTPSPMKFLNDILDRPSNERPFLLLVVGYPAEDAVVPRITKKPPKETQTWFC